MALVTSLQIFLETALYIIYQVGTIYKSMTFIHVFVKQISERNEDEELSSDKWTSNPDGKYAFYKASKSVWNKGTNA